ncbi:MAG: hypothetical protein SVR08_11885 [Spirochaetota bacterium]|nr:hypothetical protein [Thermodesulfobacteriota bacterium]MDY6969335.1 hypothetical protein [Spirochaetota bacterium]
MNIKNSEIAAELLAKFIAEKIRSYVEPQRKGTPKGEPIGFSKKKYMASLLMMTGFNQKIIASDLGVSYGLLRNWNTEKPFKKLVEKHNKEFNEFLMVSLVFRPQGNVCSTLGEIDRLKEIKPLTLEEKGYRLSPKTCPSCNAQMVFGPVSCPDRRPDCLVAHYGYICKSCGKQWV